MHASTLERTHGANTAGENVRQYDGARRGNVSLQADPLVGQSWNSYDYASSNPIKNIDPMGLRINMWDCIMIANGYWDDYSTADIIECTLTGGVSGGGGGGGGGGDLGGWGGLGPCEAMEVCAQTYCIGPQLSAIGVFNEFDYFYGNSDPGNQQDYYCIWYECDAFLSRFLDECYESPWAEEKRLPAKPPRYETYYEGGIQQVEL